MTKKKKSCFLIGPIGEPGTPERARWEEIKAYMKLVLPKMHCAFRPADSFTGQVISQGIYEQLHSADLVVADLHGGNANVYFEVGIRLMLDKPLLCFLNTGETPKFDLFDLGVLQIASTGIGDLEKLKDAVKSLLDKLDHGQLDFRSPVASYMRQLDGGPAQ